MYHPFSITQTLNIAWHIFKKNVAIISVYFIIGLIIIGLSVFLINLVPFNTFFDLFAVLAIFIIVSFVFLGFIKLVFQLIDKEYYDFEIKDILPKPKMVVNYVLLLIIVSTPVVFITKGINNMVPGVLHNILGFITDWIFQIFFIFYLPICNCFIVDDNSGFFESIKQTNQLIKGNLIKYTLLLILLEGMIFVFFLTIIGIIFIIPFVNIILAVTYRKLIYSHLDVDDDVTETV